MSNATCADTRLRERGAISIKTLLMLVLVAIVAFMVVKLAPPYIEQQKVVHDVNELARVAAVRVRKEDESTPGSVRVDVRLKLPDNCSTFVTRNEKGVQLPISYQR